MWQHGSLKKYLSPLTLKIRSLPSSICLSMVSAGLDTLANTLLWSFGYLATRPDIQQKTYDEMYKIYGGEPPDSSIEDVRRQNAL
jgi:phenylacetate 2-hydroxylase